MAKAPTTAPPDRPESTALSTAGSTELAAFDPGEVEGLQGLGYSDKQEDSLVPLFSLLQDNSGEVKERHPKRIQGARAGNMIMRSLKKVVDVDVNPLAVIPCAFTHYWVQWRGEPGEGKTITQYPFDDRPKDAREVPDSQNPDKKIWVMPNGDRLQDTRYHYCIALVDEQWMPVVIPMGGTNHTVSRQWTALQKQKLIPGSQTKAPAWFCVYQLKTQYQSSGAQSWFTYDVRDGGWVPDKLLRDEGRRIYESVQEGVLTADVRSDEPDKNRDQDQGDSPV